jgi:glycine cleavage system H protein
LLEDTPEKVNEDPYGDGWMIQIDLDDPSNREGLMTASEYTAFVEES